MTKYTLEPTRDALHGKFSRELPPILTIDPGDTVVYRTLDADWNVEPPRPAVSDRNRNGTSDGPRSDAERSRKFSPRRDDGSDDGRCLCGPIAIRGARPGTTLEIRIEEVRVGAWGWTAAAGWPHRVNERLDVAEGGVMHHWTLDADKMTGTNQFGHEIRLQPFMGVMGMPPDQPGMHPTPPPRPTGGNLDCKELTAGTTLYLPVAVEGGLFSVGDGHAAQGDGEVCVTAIECPMERVALTFHVRDDLSIAAPRVRTADAFLTLGLHEDLNEAGFLAIEAMLDHMQEQYDLARRDALALASLVVDLRVTKIVNGVQGIHAVLRHDALKIPTR